MKRFVVDTSAAGKRLDVFVVKQLPYLSRAFVQKLCDQDKIKVNKLAQNAGYKLKEGDKVSVDYDGEELKQIPKIDIPILYEDEDCIVINKSAGLLTHSKGAPNPEATVATWLCSYLQTASAGLDDANGDQRMGIVHRLDRGTSGVMIVAKNQAALAWLQKQFSSRNVKKTYLAIVEGNIEPSEAVIDMPIERNPRKPQTFRTGTNGKPAKTGYKVIKSSKSGQLTLVELKPETGRTHQLRVHLKQINHPIVGDTFYDGKTAPRLFLHAQSLEITLPNRERKLFEVPPPKDFADYLETGT